MWKEFDLVSLHSIAFMADSCSQVSQDVTLQLGDLVLY